MHDPMGPDDPFSQLDRPQGSNPLAIVGFVLSILLSPIGLIVSLFGLAKQPRGFAIAGVIIGLLGSAIWGCVGAGLWFGQKAGMMNVIQITKTYAELTEDIKGYSAAHAGKVPADALELASVSTLPNDPWGAPYVYTADAAATSYSLSSPGKDGQLGTADDIVILSTETPQMVSTRLMNEAMARTGMIPPQPGTSPSPKPFPAQPAPQDTEPAPAPAPATEPKPAEPAAEKPK